MTINVKKHTPTFLFSALMFTCLGSNVVLAQVMPPVLTTRDFSVQIKDQPVALGDRWSPDSAGKIDVPWEGSFVGEVPFDGTNYKFYQGRCEQVPDMRSSYSSGAHPRGTS